MTSLLDHAAARCTAASSIARLPKLPYVVRVLNPANAIGLVRSNVAQTYLSRLGRASGGVVWAVGVAIAVAYVYRYARDPNLPGHQVDNPLGWWGWFDQSMTLRSTVALAQGNLDGSQHHYPLGYSLLAVPFYVLLGKAAFSVIDLLCLMGAYAGFIAFARRLQIPPAIAAVLFAYATVLDSFLFRQWLVPWNTTPVAALIWLLLATCAAWLDGRRRPLLVGLLTGGVLACRPSDGLIVAPCLGLLVWSDRHAWSARLGDGVRIAAGALLIVLPVVALHLAIYGFAESLYMRSSAQIGFTLHDFAWKAYVILIDPNPWFADGEGLLQHRHWIALALAGIVPALVRAPKDRMLAAVLVVHGLLYISYVDLLPTGFWRFLNVHYFAWAIPGYALLAATLLRDLARAGWRRRTASASLAGTAVLLCIRLVPSPVSADQPAKAVDFAGPLPPFADTYLAGKLVLDDGLGVLRDQHDIRGFIYPGGVRVVGLRRDLVGPIEWQDGGAPPGFNGTEPSARWGISAQFGWPPRWIRRAAAPGIPVPLH